MRSNVKDVILPITYTLIMLCILEIFSTTFLPMFGLSNFKLPFNVLIILYLGFKLETPYLPIFIAIVQYFHSFFTIEGWELGTIAGIGVSMAISYLKELLDFSSAILTIFVTQIFQVIWFVIVAALIYLRYENLAYITEKFWRFIPESIFVSLVAPIFFVLLDRVWIVSNEGILNEGA